MNATTQTAETKVGDIVDVTIVEVRMVNRVPVETPVVYTFRVESVDDFGKTWGCRGEILATTAVNPTRPVGSQMSSYLAKAA